ncbi:MAG: dihydropteroate synthase [Bacteroidales bacterium]|nr:dihydropteroate synthase [Bacteroidales bacterium]
MFTLNIRGRLVTFDRPAVMGILNVTPDSFFSGSRAMSAYDIERRVETMLTQGVDIIDIGACSTRPGAEPVSDDEETARLSRGMEIVRRLAPDIPVSVDTFHASVARRAVTTMGCDIVNDISGGTLDDNMAATVADLHCPYILMHMRGTPATMQTLTEYGDDVTATVISELQRQVRRFEQAGVADIIIDPGFGFAKTVDQNYAVMAGLRRFAIFGRPVLVGISRKSMITKVLSIRADEALEATTALNAYALDRGADILRVHDVAAARQAVDIHVRIASASSDR